MLCKCGCKREVIKQGNYYINGHNSRGKKQSENHIRKRIDSRKKNGKQWHSKKTKEKISESHKGMKCPWQEGNKNPAKSPEVKEKIRQASLKQFENGMPEETKRKISKSLTGENHPQFNGWSSRLPYAPDWGPKVKGKVLNRDGYICQNPDCWKKDETLVPHHINYDKQNCDSTNLISLCSSCNIRANINRNYWKKLYKEMIL